MRKRQIYHFTLYNQSKKGMLFKQLCFCLLPAFLGVLIIALSRMIAPETVEAIYSQRVYRWLSAVFGLLGRVPFSMAEVILLVLILGVLIAAVMLPILLLKAPCGPKAILSRYLCGIVLTPSLILLLFSLTCAPNYSRPTFSTQSGLDIRPSSVGELTGLCVSLLQQTRQALDELGEQTTTGAPFPETSRKVQAAFNTLEQAYPFLGQAPLAAKPMLCSEVLSMLNLTGFYFPYTAEANVNAHMPDTELPFTMAHELAHTCGFMREDEANFIGYLACMRSDDPYIRYSGLYSALAHSMNMLYSVDPALYYALREQYGERLDADSKALSAYWQPYSDTPAATISNQVNDAYLKANNLTDGVQSYGRMVDLLLAEARAKQNAGESAFKAP